MRQNPKNITKRSQNRLHLSWNLYAQNVLRQTSYGSQNIPLGKHGSCFPHVLTSPWECQAIPRFPLCPSTQMDVTVGFIPKTNRVQSPDSLFLGRTLCHQGEVPSWSCRSRGYRDGCTTAACMDQRFGTETHNSHEMKCRT